MEKFLHQRRTGFSSRSQFLLNVIHCIEIKGKSVPLKMYKGKGLCTLVLYIDSEIAPDALSLRRSKHIYLSVLPFFHVKLCYINDLACHDLVMLGAMFPDFSKPPMMGASKGADVLINRNWLRLKRMRTAWMQQGLH